MTFDIVGDDIVRKKFLYGFSNMAVIFTPMVCTELSSDSRDYYLLGSCVHECHSPEDFILDFKASFKAGLVSIHFNDVIGIKINGSVICYRYFCGRYFKIEGFTDKEKNAYFRSLHRKNCVLSILDGQEIGLEKINFKKSVFYAIEGESYRMRLKNKNDFVTTDYSLYTLFGDSIDRINPYNRPFFEIAAAISYYYDRERENKRKGKKAYLLFNCKELNLLRDYRQINELSLDLLQG